MHGANMKSAEYKLYSFHDLKCPRRIPGLAMYWHSQASRLLKMEAVYSVRTQGTNYPTAQYCIFQKNCGHSHAAMKISSPAHLKCWLIITSIFKYIVKRVYVMYICYT
jgi:hypothetical protein